jgi:hypothetical protein
MKYKEENYCIGCGSELIPTGTDPLVLSTFYTCSNCNMDYIVTKTDRYTITVEIDTTEK